MGATFYPEEPPKDAVRQEKDVFRALQETLVEGWTVIHGAHWQRVERKYEERGEADFLLIHPEKGFLVLEVKGGTIRYDPAKDRWTSESEGRRISDLGRGPVKQANRSRYRFLDYLKEAPRAGKYQLPHGVGIVFPDLWGADGIEVPGIDAGLIATGKEIGRLGKWAEEALRSQAPDDNLLSAQEGKLQAKRLIDYLAPTLHLRPQLAAGIDRDRREIRELSEEQSVVLANVDTPRLLVTGGAGTGKTVLAVERAVSLARAGARTLLTCYNRSLASWVRDSVRRILEATEEEGLVGSRLVIRNLHDWAVETTGAEYESGADFWDEKLPEAVFDLATVDPELKFDAVVVDEAQDFSDAWWVVIEALVGEGGFLWVFQDPNQAIYKKPERFPSGMLQLGLNRNFRNTRAIHEAYQPFYSGPEIEAAGPEGRDVTRVTGVPSAELATEIGKLLADFVDKDGLRPDQLAVLSPIRRESAVVGEKMLGRFPTCTPAEREPGAVVVDTIHGFKGLERPVVILCEMDRCYSGTRDELHYVGMSRASAHLVVVETEGGS